MRYELAPTLPPEVSVVGNASQSTLELLNELVKQGAVVIQNATLMQNVTVNHSNISVASANCNQTITTHCMGNNVEEVERTVCAGGHDVSSTNKTRCDPSQSEWTAFDVPATAEDNTIRIIPNMDGVNEEPSLWPPFSWRVCRKQEEKRKPLHPYAHWQAVTNEGIADKMLEQALITRLLHHLTHFHLSVALFLTPSTHFPPSPNSA